LPKTNEDESHVKRMADHLRQGATLTELACPACASPLLRFRNQELWCATCQKKVIVVKEGEEAKLASNMTLDALEATLLAKIQEIQNRMQNEQDPDELQKLGTALTGLLNNLEKTRKAKKA
jgi:uncharacterized Zn finger protein (UPF0148 family)